MQGSGKNSRRRAGTAFGHIFDRVLDACAWIGCLCIAFQVLTVSLEVVARYFFGVSFGWVTSLNEWSLVALTFLGVAWLQREGGHTSDDSMVRIFPAWVRPAGQILGHGLAILTCLVLVWYGTKVTLENYRSGAYDFFKMKEIPVFWIYAVIPLGSLLWLIQILREIGTRASRRSAAAAETPDM